MDRIGISIFVVVFCIAVLIPSFIGPTFVSIYQQAGNTENKIASSDSTCNGEKNVSYDLGYGIEHSYDGKITPEQKVYMVLSCDHKKLTITGAVNQVISSSELKQLSYMAENEKIYFDDNTELADLGSGNGEVVVEDDYNFDGYNDLSSLWSNGQGVNAIDSYFIFLYDPAARKFVLNSDLSSLENLYLDEDTKELTQYFNLGQDGYLSSIYKWDENKKLYHASENNCQSNRQYDNSDTVKYYIEEHIAYQPNGDIASTTKHKLTISEATEICFGGESRI